MADGKSIDSLHVYRQYPIRGHLICKTKHVIYVWSCSCGFQGVGECANIHLRFPDYEKAILSRDQDPQSFSCSIEQHFVEKHESLDEVCFTLVDTLGPKPARKPWVIRCLRKRLENQ